MSLHLTKKRILLIVVFVFLIFLAELFVFRDVIRQNVVLGWVDKHQGRSVAQAYDEFFGPLNKRLGELGLDVANTGQFSGEIKQNPNDSPNGCSVKSYEILYEELSCIRKAEYVTTAEALTKVRPQNQATDILTALKQSQWQKNAVSESFNQNPITNPQFATNEYSGEAIYSKWHGKVECRFTIDVIPGAEPGEHVRIIETCSHDVRVFAGVFSNDF